MIGIAIAVSYIFLIAGTLLGLYRLFAGPDILNRILAFDYLAACIICLTTLYSIQNETFEFLELILIFGLLGFATVMGFMEIFFWKAGRDG